MPSTSPTANPTSHPTSHPTTSAAAASSGTFPSVSAALGAGWSFFKANFWLVVLFSAVSGFSFGFTAQWCIDTYRDSSAGVAEWLVAAAIVAVDGVIHAICALVLCRRAFDYREESAGRAASRSFSAGLSSAFHGALPRVFPYLGWSLFQASAFLLVIVVGFIVADAVSDGLAIIIYLVMIAAMFAVSVVTAFYDLAAADGPGNPLTKSAAVFNGHFWSVVKVVLAFALIAMAVAVPIALVVMAVTHDSFGDAVSAVTSSGVYTMVAAAIGVGTRTSMYRAVFPQPAPQGSR